MALFSFYTIYLAIYRPNNYSILRVKHLRVIIYVKTEKGEIYK